MQFCRKFVNVVNHAVLVLITWAKTATMGKAFYNCMKVAPCFKNIGGTYKCERGNLFKSQVTIHQNNFSM